MKVKNETIFCSHSLRFVVKLDIFKTTKVLLSIILHVIYYKHKTEYRNQNYKYRDRYTIKSVFVHAREFKRKILLLLQQTMENCEETSPGPSENYTGEDVDVSHDVDGKRMQLLKQSLDLSLEKFYSSIKYDF